MKTKLFTLLLAGICLGALAQLPPAAPPGTNDVREQLRELLRRRMAGDTNPIAPPLAQPTTPAPTTAPPGVIVEPDAAAPAQSDIAVPPQPEIVTPAQPQPTQPAAGLPAQAGESVTTLPPATANPAPEQEELIDTGIINWTGADLSQVLTIYASLVNRTILRAPNLASPPIVLQVQTPLTRREAIQALDAVLALHGIAIVPVAEKFAKAVPVAQVDTVGAEFNRSPAAALPELGQYVTHIAHLTTARPSEVAPILQQFGNTKSILPVDSSGILVIRDYAENVKRMLEFIEEIDVMPQSEFISKVIPIKYALATEIANALNSLSGSASSTTVGGSGAAGGRTTGGIGTRSRTGYQAPGTTPTGIPTAAGGAAGQPTFQQRLQNIIRRASTPGSGDIEVIGVTKIIADERTNSLLVFASRPDMAMIEDIVSKLDVVLAQVLIEAIIMEVSLDDTFNLGVSYLQKQKDFGSVQGIGAIRNGSFLNAANFLTNAANSLPSGFSYFARVNDDLEVTATAIAGNNRVNVLSRPKVQTSHAVPATLFIGDTVPYISGTTYGDFTGATSRSVYQQRDIGIALDVLPLINPDGLVVMDIQQDIEQLGTPVTIDGNSVPTTTKRSAVSKVAVKDGDTIVLGGFISTTKSTSRSGVPLLKDIPLLGYLFRSTGDTHRRVELIVLIRPTVLPTPEAAALAVAETKQEMPGVRRGEAEIRKAEQKELNKAKRILGN